MARLPAETQLLALALLSSADDEGYFRADEAIIRGSCAPFRDNLASISRDLERLSEVGWIELGEHPNQGKIGLIANWKKHQRVDHPSASKLKDYFIRESLANTREGLAPDQGSGIRDQGKEQGGLESPAAEAAEGVVRLDLDALRLRVGAMLRRRPDTAWSEKELKALKVVFKLKTPEDQIQALEARYRSGDQFLRRDVLTLLNNWNGEIDRAMGVSVSESGGSEVQLGRHVPRHVQIRELEEAIESHPANPESISYFHGETTPEQIADLRAKRALLAQLKGQQS